MPFAIDASQLHPSTRLALTGLEWLEQRASPARILDMGCGNGILSLASAHYWDADILACDIAEEAIRDTHENIRQFAPDAAITVLRSDGFKHPDIAAHGSYGLIIGNLIAQWQVQMARDMASLLNPGGHALLSGILLWQKAGVAEALSTAGIEVIQLFNEESWVCLIGQKPL